MKITQNHHFHDKSIAEIVEIKKETTLIKKNNHAGCWL
jgi:hypothetical protein